MDLQYTARTVIKAQRICACLAWDRLGPLKAGDRVMVSASESHEYAATIFESQGGLVPFEVENVPLLVKVHEIDPRFWLDEHQRAPQATPIDVSVICVFRASEAT